MNNVSKISKSYICFNCLRPYSMKEFQKIKSFQYKKCLACHEDIEIVRANIPPSIKHYKHMWE